MTSKELFGFLKTSNRYNYFYVVAKAYNGKMWATNGHFIIQTNDNYVSDFSGKYEYEDFCCPDGCNSYRNICDEIPYGQKTKCTFFSCKEESSKIPKRYYDIGKILSDSKKASLSLDFYKKDRIRAKNIHIYKLPNSVVKIPFDRFYLDLFKKCFMDNNLSLFATDEISPVYIKSNDVLVGSLMPLSQGWKGYK